MSKEVRIALRETMGERRTGISIRKSSRNNEDTLSKLSLSSSKQYGFEAEEFNREKDVVSDLHPGGKLR
ncbi:hypothetical protein [Pseudomonas luteola]|uniref:hypothetical protein n=1 Tax=Pseudomonas luteola TaxID=47886 RepID=UPI0015EC5BC6|nr:hypothetical protein [Pseudomonas luteola]